jgi:SSS family solute:Na+ symporter
VGAGILVGVLQYSGAQPLDQASGVWGLLLATLLFVGVSLATPAPQARAAEFLGHVSTRLKEHRAL